MDYRALGCFCFPLPFNHLGKSIFPSTYIWDLTGLETRVLWLQSACKLPCFRVLCLFLWKTVTVYSRLGTRKRESCFCLLSKRMDHTEQSQYTWLFWVVKVLLLWTSHRPPEHQGAAAAYLAQMEWSDHEVQQLRVRHVRDVSLATNYFKSWNTISYSLT